MLDINYIKENAELVKTGAENKKIKCDVDALLSCYEQKKALMFEVETLRAEKNKGSKAIQKLQGEEKKAAIMNMKETAAQLKEKEPELTAVNEQFDSLMLTIPSPPHADAPIGKDDTENRVLRTVGQIPTFDFDMKDHIELGESLDIIDIQRGVKISGTRNYFLKGMGALLEIAIMKYAVDFIVKRGFTPMIVPALVKYEAMMGTGYFPGGEEQAYHCEKDELSLIGTSEVPVASFHMNETLQEKELPKLYAGYSQCFRREAGTYGKDTRGLYRIHQFEKVEQVVLCKNDEQESARMHEMLLKNAEDFVASLQIPYRVVDVCTGDLGMGQVKKNDIECWMPSRESYGETHSCSTFYDFQARRLNLKYKCSETGKNLYCHTLNNTLIATPRVLIPLIECNQTADGHIVIPEALQPYMNGAEII